MECKRDGLVPAAEVFSGLGGPVKALAKISPRRDNAHVDLGAGFSACSCNPAGRIIAMFVRYLN